MAATINPVTFFKEVRTELGKVIWPTRAETIRLTLIVIGVSLAIGLYIGALDVTMTKITEILVRK